MGSMLARLEAEMVHANIWHEKCIMFFGLQVDRGNLVQAVSDNLLDDLKLSTNGTSSYNYNQYSIIANWYICRLQYRQYHLLRLVFVGRIAISAGVKIHRS